LWCIVVTAAGGGHPERAEDAAGRGCVHGGDLPPQPHPGAAGASLTRQCAVLALVAYPCTGVVASKPTAYGCIPRCKSGLACAPRSNCKHPAILRHGFKPGRSLQRAAPSALPFASILLCTFNNWVHLCRAATYEHQPLQPGLRLQDQGARRQRRTRQQRQRGALISFQASVCQAMPASNSAFFVPEELDDRGEFGSSDSKPLRAAPCRPLRSRRCFAQPVE